MRVLHIITVNGIGGAERQLLTLLSALKIKEVEVTCLIFHKARFLQHAGDLVRQLHDRGIDVSLREYSTVFHPSNINFLETFILQQKPDLIHAHLRHVELWLAILKWRKKISTPVISTIHGYNDRFHGSFGMDFNKVNKLSAYYQATKFIGRNLDTFIAISKGIARLFTSAGLYEAEKIRVVPHGTEIDDDSIPSNKKVPPDIVMIGRLVRFKGHHFAIEAIAHLKRKFPDVRLHIYGVGPEEAALKKLVDEKQLSQAVIFHGFTENIQSAIKDHSVALVPSIGEPFGIVFFDCFKAGLPVVAFDVPASNEIIDDRYNGLLAQPGNPEDLSRKVEMLLIDPDLFHQVVINATTALKERFDIDKIAGDYLDIYRQVVGSGQGKLNTSNINQQQAVI